MDIVCEETSSVVLWFSLYCCLQMLAKKVDTLHKSKEVEAKKKRQEIAALEKKFAAVCLEQERLGNLRGPGTSQTVSGRYAL